LGERLAEMREEPTPVKRTKSQNEQVDQRKRSTYKNQRKNEDNSIEKASVLAEEKTDVKSPSSITRESKNKLKRKSSYEKRAIKQIDTASFSNNSQEREHCAHCQVLNKQHFDTLMKDLYRFLIIGMLFAVVCCFFLYGKLKNIEQLVEKLERQDNSSAMGHNL